MADSVEHRMSVTSIKRVDPYVKEILSSATHVALYKFNTSLNHWEKTETEGALFVYSRNGEPFHSIMVMNRLNTENLIEPLVKDFDYQMQPPFLLYRNSRQKIYGIWFFQREDCMKISVVIGKLMDSFKEPNQVEDKDKINNGVDIFGMLSKAQEDFNKTPTKQNGVETALSVSSSTPRVLNMTSQSVMEFFAQASTKSTQKPVAGPSGEHVLQRLMSNPAHSVEHIEKQQRSVTPQEVVKQASPNPTQERRSVPISLGDKNGLRVGSSSPYSSLSPLAHILQARTEDTSPQFNQTKPQLMTPMMFTTASSNTQPPDLDNSDLLTEKQLAQALIYLLRNNSDFTKQIHEAYVNSIMERVNKKSLL